MKAIDFKIAKAQDLLAKLDTEGADATVINAQKKIVDRLLKERHAVEVPNDAAIKIRVNDGRIVSRKICHANFQRSIKPARVDEFLKLFNDGKYESAYPILVITVAKAKELSLKIFDFQGNNITDTADENWLVIIDGQHRALASAILNSNEECKEFVFENVVTKDGITNLSEYLSTINGKEISNYSDSDRLEILAERDSDDELIQTVYALTQKGIKQSTAERMVMQKPIPRKKYNESFMSSNSLTKLLSPEEQKKIDVADAFRLFSYFQMIKVDLKFVSRYWIEGFNSFAKSHDRTKAFDALQALNVEEIRKLSCGDDFVEELKAAYESLTTQSLTVAG